MRSQQLISRVRALSIGFAMLACAVTSTGAQAPETMTAVANVRTAGGTNASAPITIVIERFASNTDRDALVAAVKTSGTSGARELLGKRGDVGSIQVGSKRTPIKYAYARSTGSGRLLTLATAEPIGFTGSDLPQTAPKAGYDLGLVLLEITASGPGHGELAPATKVRVDQQNAIVTEGSDAEVVRLSNVVKK
jgi:hypothetical protein